MAIMSDKTTGPFLCFPVGTRYTDRTITSKVILQDIFLNWLHSSHPSACIEIMAFSLNSLLVFLFSMWQEEAEALCKLAGVESWTRFQKTQQKVYCNFIYYIFFLA
jgi:hypothetical protein